MKKITVCIADMDVGYRASLRKALESSGSVEVVADAGTVWRHWRRWRRCTRRCC